MPVVALTIADVLRLGQRLTSTPQVFSRVGRLLRDPNSSIDEIVKLVKLDAALALRVLQLSNGAFYGSSSGAVRSTRRSTGSVSGKSTGR